MNSNNFNQIKLIKTTLEKNILKFGNFKLKSNRSSPYFFNFGLINQSFILNLISLCFTDKLIEIKKDFNNKNKNNNNDRNNDNFNFEILFGPSYKGIPLAAITLISLNRLDEKNYDSIGLSYNRKEVKDHGEGGLIVGAPLKGKRVVIIDDVITAGTAIRESIELIKEQGGILVGVVVLLDRQEKLNEKTDRSAVQAIEEEFQINVFSVLKLIDIINFMKASGDFQDELQQMEAYRRQWGISTIQS